MNQKIFCQKDKCFEVETVQTEFDSMFNDNNIVQKIEHDLWNRMLN